VPASRILGGQGVAPTQPARCLRPSRLFLDALLRFPPPALPFFVIATRLDAVMPTAYYPLGCDPLSPPGGPVKRFVERQNVAHYKELLKVETDPIRRAILQRLLSEEEAKQASHLDERKSTPP
jgi:hypothetical protein